MDDERIVAKCYLELGEVTKEKGEYDESLRYHRKSIEIFERIDDPLSLADSHLNIADIYKARGELKQAMSEYEKGLSLYEDIYVDDANKNSDTSTDISLASSSVSDLQRTRSLSKSERILPQATTVDNTDKEILIKNESISAKKSIDDSAVHTLEKSINQQWSSSVSDLLAFNDNDMSPVFSSVETTPILESKSINSSSNTTDLDEDNQIILADSSTTNDDKQINFDYLTSSIQIPSKAILIILLSICLAGVLLWSYSGTSSLSKRAILPKKISKYHSDELSDQLRKYLTWQKDRLILLNKNSRRIVDEFLTQSANRTKLSIDRFQRIMEIGRAHV